jgi:hypothetical protein
LRGFKPLKTVTCSRSLAFLLGGGFFLLADVVLTLVFVTGHRTKHKNGPDIVHAGGSNCSNSNAKCGGRLLGIDFASISMHDISVKGKLVGAEQLLDQLFDQEARPSIRWLRQQTKAKAIPFIRIGHLVFFDVDMVRTALGARNLVQGRRLTSAYQKSSPGLN